MTKLEKLLIGIIAVSIAFNGVLAFNTKKEFDRTAEVHKTLIEKKDKYISELKDNLTQQKVENVKTQEADASKNKTDNNSISEVQNQYKDAANQFIHAYLDYSVQNKGERRTNLLKVTDKKIVDMIAPDAKDLGDPNFKSTVNQASIFIDAATDISKKCNAIIEVEYTIEGLENKQTKIRSLVKITLEKQEQGIKVVEFNPYPIK
ncbi:hypothetical protein IEE_05481 [Bacillus cereus BAG5X1-1]|uniref:Uncharacterized protein n=1 Tax=Bacillus cereus BAG5X1-1 TaxID=1053189 RepID=J8A918_BACCE|nr:hypothetical protein [Bacillus cereus]EJQ36005.1 hypothetical protein IEE_05481 [Bacillus cereus BAG5X1-1]